MLNYGPPVDTLLLDAKMVVEQGELSFLIVVMTTRKAFVFLLDLLLFAQQ